MKRKKLVASAMTGMLAVAQMVMPVAAADGTVDVSVQTITPVIRVEVPTSLTIAVNQFEKSDMGSQIYSTAFGIKNKSEVPVKMTVTSTATLGTGDNAATLVSTKAAAEAEATDKKAWLAVAAQVVDGKYIADTTKGIKDLTEADKNVTTFVTESSESTAKQTFYLATAQTPVAVTYKAIVTPGTDSGENTLANAKAKGNALTYAKFYEMSEYDTDSTTTGTQAISDVAKLQKALESNDIYEIKDDGTAVKFFAKGTTTGLTVQASGVKYCTMAATNTVAGSFVAGKIYVYGEGTDGGKTGFRYIGKLSNVVGWSKDNISAIKIEYDIAAMSQDSYNGVKAACTYSLYNSLVGKTVNGVSVMNDNATPAAISTKASMAARLKNNPKLQFTLNAAQLAVVKAEGLSIQGVKVNPTPASGGTTATAIDCTATVVANTDGSVYTIAASSGDFTNLTSVDSIEVTYKKSSDATAGMTVKFTFAAQ